jgi:hypothetical protein
VIWKIGRNEWKIKGRIEKMIKAGSNVKERHG